ncbi:MAG: DMT family transporter [Lachnospiraceae bacterium]|nr:DMT family transporter [Lachnospiraceae bacterium]MBR5738626.1 DMT family transporter [Lachnospiraceae bacterium]
MSWLFFAVICVLGWGCADLFYKKGTDESDRYSHLKIAVWVGLVMGIVSFVLLPFSESRLEGGSLFASAVQYFPASLSYIISMVIGYAGLRYLEISIVSPVQNASGALSMLAMLVFFLVTGAITDFWEEYSVLDVIGTVLIIAGVILLAVVEQHLSKEEKQSIRQSEKRKYRYGALALVFPILYCVFDTIGTAADGIILSEEAGLGLGEIDVLVLYGLTFFAAGIGAYVFLWIKEKKPYNPFAKSEWPKGVAAIAEQFGQIFYVFAMSRNPVLAAPVVASYCIVSVILSRIFLKEKLKKNQYAAVAIVVLGILLLGISEGIAAARESIVEEIEALFRFSMIPS